MQLRPPRVADTAAIAALLNEHGRALHGTDEVDAAEVAGWLGIPSLDPQRDMRLAVGVDGTLLGYGDVTGGGERKLRYWLDVRLRPAVDERVGHALFDALEARARETAAAGARIGAYASERDETARRILAARGYDLVRHDFHMEVGLGEEPVPAPVWPEGIELRRYADEDDGRVYEANMESFAGHWEFEREPYDAWAHGRSLGPHDPSLWFLAHDGNELAGICLCRPLRTGDPSSDGSRSSASCRPGAGRGSDWRSSGTRSASSTVAACAASGSASTPRTRRAPCACTGVPACDRCAGAISRCEICDRNPALELRLLC